MRYRAYNERTKHWENNCFNLETESPNLRNGFIFQLCSGMKDRVGRWIYDGDIVAVNHFGVMQTYEIVFKDGAFWCGKDNIELLFEVSDKCVVVGNIFNI